VTVAFRDEAAPDHTVRLPVAALSIAGSDPSGGVRRGHSVRTPAKRWVTGALQAADRLVIVGGRGPVHHFHGSPGPLFAIPREVPA